MINAIKSSIGKDFKIGEGSSIHCESFTVGDFCYIGKNVKIVCRDFKAGNFLFIKDNAEIGHGGQYNDTSVIKMGDGVFIGERAVVNTANPVIIGNEVGIGDDSKIWTHGSYLSIIDGFPSKFDSVEVGSNVWIQSMTHIMPGTKIGNDTVILCSSIVSKNVPSGCLFGGNPGKIIRENAYPKKLSFEEKIILVEKLTKEWIETLNGKRTEVIVTSSKMIGVENEILSISFEMSDNKIVHCKMDLRDRKSFVYDGHMDIIEDYRDFLRRHGIRFMTNLPFKSIKSKWNQF